MDRPEAFGQHFNAGIAYQQQESRGLLDSLAAMQSQSAADPAADDRQQVMTTMARLAAQVRTPALQTLSDERLLPAANYHRSEIRSLIHIPWPLQSHVGPSAST